MTFLIDAKDGRTITANLADCGQAYPFVDRIDIHMDSDITIPCRLSTARSLEAEAVKEAAELFVDVMKRNDIADGAESIDSWLDKWGRE